MISNLSSTFRSSPLSTWNRNTAGRKLEKHLDDVNKGRGELSASVGTMMQKVHVHTGLSLAGTNPSAAIQYNAYQTGFNYHQQSRVALAVHDVQNTLTRLDEAHKNAETFERELETILQDAESSESNDIPPTDPSSEDSLNAVNQKIQQAISNYLAVSPQGTTATLISTAA